MVDILQERINQTEYWDAEIIDFYINYFGDEVNVIVYCDSNTSWKITFVSCYKVNYETDANWRTIEYVREMKRPQRGYYGQDITLKESAEGQGFYDVSLDLTILTVQIVCKEINVDKIHNDVGR